MPATELHSQVGEQYNVASGDVTFFSGDCRVYRLTIQQVGSTATNVDIYDGSSAAGTRIGTLRTQNDEEVVEWRSRQGYYCDTSFVLDVTAGTTQIVALYFRDESGGGKVA